MPTAYTMVTAHVTVFQFQSLQPTQLLRFFRRYSKEGHAEVLLSSIDTQYAGITRLFDSQLLENYWGYDIGTYGYLRGPSALVLSCFLYYSLRTSARPKYSGHDVDAILNLIKILSLSVNLSIEIQGWYASKTMQQNTLQLYMKTLHHVSHSSSTMCATL